MAMNVFYSMVKEFAEQLLAKEPKIALSANAQLCAILTKDHDIISGVSAVYMLNENMGIIPAEYMAVVAMNNAGITRALQMITINLSDFSVVMSNPGELYLVQSLCPENIKCNVYVSPTNYIPISTLTAPLGLNPSEQDSNAQPRESQNQHGNNNNTAQQDYFGGFGNEDAPQPIPKENAISSQSVTGLFSGFGDEQLSDNGVPDTNELEKMGFITNTSYGDVSHNYSDGNSPLNNRAEYSSDYNVDENNPFADNSGNPDKNNDVVYFAEVNKDGSANSVSNNYGGQPRQVAEQNLSMDELLKQAKQKKKVAKANFNIRKK